MSVASECGGLYLITDAIPDKDDLSVFTTLFDTKLKKPFDTKLKKKAFFIFLFNNLYTRVFKQTGPYKLHLVKEQGEKGDKRKDNATLYTKRRHGSKRAQVKVGRTIISK